LLRTSVIKRAPDLKLNFLLAYGAERVQKRESKGSQWIDDPDCDHRMLRGLFLPFLMNWDEPNLTGAACDWTNFAPVMLARARACQKFRDKLESFRKLSRPLEVGWKQ
jgi:hypothetical protein